jgi:hypothetical protein
MKPEILQNLAIAVLRSFPWAQPYRMKTAAWNNVAAEFNEALPPGQATLTGIQAKRQVERSIKEYQAYKKDAAAGKDYLSFEHLYGNSALRSQLEILLQRREIIGRNLVNWLGECLIGKLLVL